MRTFTSHHGRDPLGSLDYTTSYVPPAVAIRSETDGSAPTPESTTGQFTQSARAKTTGKSKNITLPKDIYVIPPTPKGILTPTSKHHKHSSISFLYVTFKGLFSIVLIFHSKNSNCYQHKNNLYLILYEIYYIAR